MVLCCLATACHSRLREVPTAMHVGLPVSARVPCPDQAGSYIFNNPQHLPVDEDISISHQ